MAIVDLDSLSIEELAALRGDVTEKLAEKVAVRLGNVPIVFSTGTCCDGGSKASIRTF
jgi:hypothetical protein